MTGGKYYVFDFTQYCSGGHYNNFHAPVTVLDRLEDYYDKMPSIYSKKDVVIMVAFEAGRRCIRRSGMIPRSSRV